MHPKAPLPTIFYVILLILFLIILFLIFGAVAGIDSNARRRLASAGPACLADASLPPAPTAGDADIFAGKARPPGADRARGEAAGGRPAPRGAGVVSPTASAPPIFIYLYLFLFKKY